MGQRPPFGSLHQQGIKAPTKWLQGALARLVILSDHEQLLARSPVVSTGKVVEPVISHIESVDDREIHRASGLYDAPAHAAKAVIDRLVVKHGTNGRQNRLECLAAA